MAKANNTAMEKMIEYMDGLLKIEDNMILKYGESSDIKENWQQLNMIKSMAIKLQKEERRHIQDAFDHGQANWEKGKRDYEDGKHYFFMEYIDND